MKCQSTETGQVDGILPPLPRRGSRDRQQRRFLTRPTGFEPATSGSTVRYSNQLSYGPRGDFCAASQTTKSLTGKMRLLFISILTPDERQDALPGTRPSSMTNASGRRNIGRSARFQDFPRRESPFATRTTTIHPSSNALCAGHSGARPRPNRRTDWRPVRPACRLLWRRRRLSAAVLSVNR